MCSGLHSLLYYQISRPVLKQWHGRLAHIWSEEALGIGQNIPGFFFSYVEIQYHSKYVLLISIAPKSAKHFQVMQAMQALIRLPEIAHIMQEMSKEMMRAGIIEEMLDETMAGVEDEEEMEEAAQSEVDKVRFYAKV